MPSSEEKQRQIASFEALKAVDKGLEKITSEKRDAKRRQLTNSNNTSEHRSLPNDHQPDAVASGSTSPPTSAQTPPSPPPEARNERPHGRQPPKPSNNGQETEGFWGGSDAEGDGPDVATEGESQCIPTRRTKEVMRDVARNAEAEARHVNHRKGKLDDDLGAHHLAPQPPPQPAAARVTSRKPRETQQDNREQYSEATPREPLAAAAPPIQKRVAAASEDPIVQALETRLRERRALEKARNTELARRAELFQQQQEQVRAEREAREQERREVEAKRKQEQLEHRLQLMQQQEEARAARVQQLGLKVDPGVLQGKRSMYEVMEERRRKVDDEESKILEDKLKAIREKRGANIDLMEDVRRHQSEHAQRSSEREEQRKGKLVVRNLKPICTVETKAMLRVLEEKLADQGVLVQRKEKAKKLLDERRHYEPPVAPPVAVASDDGTQRTPPRQRLTVPLTKAPPVAPRHDPTTHRPPAPPAPRGKALPPIPSVPAAVQTGASMPPTVSRSSAAPAANSGGAKNQRSIKDAKQNASVQSSAGSESARTTAAARTPQHTTSPTANAPSKPTSTSSQRNRSSDLQSSSSVGSTHTTTHSAVQHVGPSTTRAPGNEGRGCEDADAAAELAARSATWASVRAILPRTKSEEDKQRRADLWKQFDQNGSGRLSLAEVDAGCRHILKLDGFTSRLSTVLIRAFNRANVVGGSRGDPSFVEFLEFRLLLCYIYDYFELQVMFDEIDESDDNRVSFAEFEKALPLIEKWGLRLDDASAAFAEVDVDHAGMILFSEFAAWATDKKLDADGDPDAFEGVVSSASRAPESEVSAKTKIASNSKQQPTAPPQRSQEKKGAKVEPVGQKSKSKHLGK